MAGSFAGTPNGIILHGSRSGSTTNSTAAEYVGTARYAVNEPGGLGWNATIGDDHVALHMPYSRWGWNARGCSKLYLAVEFAQPTLGNSISDGQVRAFCWFARQARTAWPKLPLVFPTHAELDGTPAYGPLDGKTDLFEKGAARTDALRARIMLTTAWLAPR